MHKLLGLFEIQELIAEHGQAVVVDSVRIIQEEYRNILRLGANAENNDFRKEVFIERVRDKISLVFGNSLRPVLNLSGISESILIFIPASPALSSSLIYLFSKIPFVVR